MRTLCLKVICLSFFGLIIFGCDDDDGLQANPTRNVNDFVYSALNLWYFWQADVPNLADDRFGTAQQRTDYLNSFSTPELLFEDLMNRPTDRFSRIFSDYDVLLNSFQGVSTSFGFEYSLSYQNSSTNSIFGFVQYVLPNSPAEEAGIQRGMLFTSANGVSLNDNNFGSALSSNSITFGFADFDNGNFTSNGTEITVGAQEFTENPIFLNTVIEEDGVKIGYLVYNGFVSSFNNDLIAAFGQLANQNVDELVLDLRYNGGGSVSTAQYLGSMITGDFVGQEYVNLRWNEKLIALNAENFNISYPFVNATADGQALNFLGLDHLYVLTTGSSASASELVINSLRPYINVTTIGTTTSGKNVGQNPLYDSAESGFTNVETAKSDHKYALLPITFSYFNAEGNNDFGNGIAPDHDINELQMLEDVKALGNAEEPLLKRAIDIILNRPFDDSSGRNESYQYNFDVIKSSKQDKLWGNSMYTEQSFYLN